MRVLGWRLSLDGDKDLRFAQVFQSLGVLFTMGPGEVAGWWFPQRSAPALPLVFGGCLATSLAVFRGLPSRPCLRMAAGRAARPLCRPACAGLSPGFCTMYPRLLLRCGPVNALQNATCFLSLFCRRCSLHWNDTGTSHPVVQAELLAACLCLHLWGHPAVG